MKSPFQKSFTFFVFTCCLYFFHACNKTKTYTPGTIQNWMTESIEKDLNEYKKAQLTKEDFLEAYNQIPHRDKAIITIENNDIKINKVPDNTPALPRLHKIMKVLREFKGIQTTFIIDIGDGDRPIENVNIPLFRFSKKKVEKGILIPDDPFASNIKNIASLKETYPWDKKKPQAYFRGATTGGIFTQENYKKMPRVQLVILAQKYPNLIDAQFSLLAPVQFEPSFIPQFKKEFPIYPRDPESTIFHYRYAIDADGNTNGWARPRYILASNTLCIKHETPFEQWFYRALEPNKHYIKVKKDFSDLPKKLRWAKENEDAVQKIISHANDFAFQVLSETAQKDYFFQALYLYSKNFTPEAITFKE